MANSTQQFIESWEGQIDGSTGLPCGVLASFIQELSKMDLHVPGLNEREAVGIAAGMWLGNQRPVVYLQNSGLFVASNDIGSLLIPCEMDIPFFVTWRGAPGETAPQHFATGAATMPLLDAFGMWHELLTEDNAAQIYSYCKAGMSTSHKPGAILVQRGWTDDSTFCASHTPKSPATKISGKIIDLRRAKTQLDRESSLSIIHSATPEDVGLISSTGLISRSLFDRHHSPNQFYNAGGFGLTSAIGLGFALASPNRQVVVVEGDSSLLTSFGNLANIGHHSPHNMVHVVVDNGAYGSCSEEPSISSSASIAETATSMGYQVYQVNTAPTLEWAIKNALERQELSLVHATIQLGGDRDFARPLGMAQNAREFRTHMS